jgi:hypothetical protein
MLPIALGGARWARSGGCCGVVWASRWAVAHRASTRSARQHRPTPTGDRSGMEAEGRTERLVTPLLKSSRRAGALVAIVIACEGSGVQAGARRPRPASHRSERDGLTQAQKQSISDRSVSPTVPPSGAVLRRDDRRWLSVHPPTNETVHAFATDTS